MQNYRLSFDLITPAEAEELNRMYSQYDLPSLVRPGTKKILSYGEARVLIRDEVAVRSREHIIRGMYGRVAIIGAEMGIAAELANSNSKITDINIYEPDPEVLAFARTVLHRHDKVNAIFHYKKDTRLEGKYDCLLYQPYMSIQDTIRHGSSLVKHNINGHSAVLYSHLLYPLQNISLAML